MDIFLDSIGLKEIRFRLFFELLHSSEIRKSEALKLRWSDISPRSRKIRIGQGKDKVRGGKDGYVPYSKAVDLFLKKWKKLSFLSLNDFLFPGKKYSYRKVNCLKALNKIFEGLRH